MINDLEKDLLQTILNNEFLLKVLIKVFDLRIEREKPQVRENDNNELLGEKYRAYELSKQMIDKGFIDLMSYKINKEQIKNFNKER